MDEKKTVKDITFRHNKKTEQLFLDFEEIIENGGFNKSAVLRGFMKKFVEENKNFLDKNNK
jgi:hypothetical protein